MTKHVIADVYNDPITIREPTKIAATETNLVVLIEIEDNYGAGESAQWIGNRDQLGKLIKALQEFESSLPPSNLPPMSNRVEGGGHFGLG